MIPPSDEICDRLVELHGLLGQSAEHLDPLLKQLTEHGVSWSDLSEIFYKRGAPPSAQPAKLRRTVNALHELIGRASTRPLKLSARDKLIKRLAEQPIPLDWVMDLPAMLAEHWHDANPGTVDPSVPADGGADVFDVVVRVTEQRVVATNAEIAVAGLWALFTYIYDQFAFAAQIGIVAPASTRGKSTFRKVLEAIACNAWHAHRITAAALPRKIVRKLESGRGRTVVMLDEVENQGFLRDEKMRGVIDALFEPDGVLTITGPDGQTIDYPAQAPVLWAVRGSLSDVPLSVRSRGFQIVMKKGKPQKPLPKLYLQDPDLSLARNLAEAWATRAQQLNLDPEMPPELCRDPRLADICRPLVAVADSLGRGAEGRAALIEVCINYPGADVGLLALEDARKVCGSKEVEERAEEVEHLFILSDWTGQRRQVVPRFDRIASKALVAGMIEKNPFWGSWRGLNDKGQPHSLTTGELSAMLSRFGIFLKSSWPLRREPGDKSAWGYTLDQFENAWREHLEGHTPAQSKEIITLSLHKTRSRRS
jgi:hypothetical protein